ncbi:hypothetical protein KAR91_14165, partial [Candidatus Pacearchaeota archaeon]|nr:hypothetical protein [Candidatus Pacearchaeota archaeon]
VYRPLLPIQITNPHTGVNYKTYGLIDTGADDCAVPASLAQIVGHNLIAGQLKEIRTGNGVTKAYAHTTKIDIFHINDSVNPVFTIHDTPVDFMPNLHCVLLGVENFLSQFILTVDYPNKSFSIQYP